MIGLDTNVLVRYLTQDDSIQSGKVNEVVEEAVAHGSKLLIHPIVLCELVWVLETAYDYARNDIATALDRILRTAQFEVAEKELAWSALIDYRSGKGDFADYMIGRANTRLGAEYTVTFDRALKTHRHFHLLSWKNRAVKL